MKIKSHAELFAALGDETRLLIVRKLAHGPPCSIAELTDGTKMTRQAVTKHLRVLERVGIVHSIRSGRESVFEFESASMQDLQDYLDFVNQKDEALMSLKDFVED